MSSKNPIRLPPLKVLRVRHPNRAEVNPCVTVMSSVLACWASAGYSTAGCSALEQALRACMDAPKPPPKPSNTINYHLTRLSKRLTAPGAKGKKKD
ncbi:hypothetical protein QBC46DRAFT_397761 [Diplogelasinospora grovesii]|uniref:Small ribosomal subunit protein mS37 n=1 Tax=Diplogelasinospora grovesii TaxID=303347 RepID=A0AAN6MYC3_9PEZI|nr:hypothetical protein QBC46DRAFT_397761 [Diplogelasinospora grovesii]